MPQNYISPTNQASLGFCSDNFTIAVLSTVPNSSKNENQAKFIFECISRLKKVFEICKDLQQVLWAALDTKNWL